MHVIFATKGRAPMIEAAWRNDLHAYLGGTVRGLGAKPLAVGGVADHIHLLTGISARHAVADFVREIKKASSIWAANHRAGFAWQAGYAAISVGHSDRERVSRYIATQEDHHRKLTSAEELRAILIEHGIPIDERFFE